MIYRLNLWQRMLCRLAIPMLALAGPYVAGTAAQDTPAANSTVEAPLVIFHSASVDRLQKQSESLFAAAGRDDMNEHVREWMKTTLRDLKGMDRSRPFGVMLYLKPGLGGVAGVMYFPVTSLDDLLGTLAGNSGDIQSVEGKANRYRYTNDFNQTYVALQREGYVFIASENDQTELDRNFPGPEKLVSRLNSRYDIAASLQIKSVPPAMRQLFVTFLQTQAQAELQQKDDEPEAAYRVRKANGENMLELIEKIVTQGEELTLGVRLDDRTGKAELDLEVAGTPDSKLAKFFQGMTGKRSLFANLLQKPSLMTLAMSWQLDEKQRKAFTELFAVAPGEIDRQVAKDGVDGTKTALTPLFDTLLQSAEAGHLDGFLQLAGEGQGGFTMLAGARVTGGANFPKQFHEALQFSKEKFSHNDRISALELDIERINGFPVHRVPLTPPDKPGQWMFGESSQLFVYASTQALWVAFGGDEALSTMKSAITEAGRPAPTAEDRQQRIPFIFQTQGKQWVTIRNESGAEPPPNRRGRRMEALLREQMNAALDDQNDGLRMEVRPTDSGARMRVEFQPGWVGVLGRMIAARIEQSAAAAPPDQPAPETEPTTESGN